MSNSSRHRSWLTEKGVLYDRRTDDISLDEVEFVDWPSHPHVNRFALNFQIRFTVNPKTTRRNGPESSFLSPSASR